MTTSTNGADRNIYDITIVGAGPTGLFAAFYAGMRKARTLIIDSLEEPGGALTAIYPEKYIYDVAGFPKILAKDLVEQMYQQAMRDEPDISLSEQVLNLQLLEDGLLELTTSKGVRLSKSVIIAGGVGAFEPKRLVAEGADNLAGKGLHYFAKRVEDFRDRKVVIVGGGDSAVDWALTLEPVATSVSVIHRSKFRAHESTVKELEESTVNLHYPGCEVVEVSAGSDGHLSGVKFKNAEGEITAIDAEELIVAIGFLADLGPLKSWGFELQKNQIVVDIVTMQTSIPGVFAAGDVCWYPAKFRLIATGAAEAVTAVNHAVLHCDPSARLDPGHSTNIMAARDSAN